MDCCGVFLTVDRRCLPSAATTAAEAPATATTGGVGQFSGAAWARTSAHGDASQCSGAGEHAFEDGTARSTGSASLQTEAKVSEIGRSNPPAQLVRGRGDLQSAGARLDASDFDQFPRVDIFTGASRIPGRVVVEHSAGC